ncbi:MAG: HEAT repeat domain-containing protein [Deltaproteobacteria bacterium]|nr:HEAT repeat domain-containing protein [Deltaproteobacteria bacterium]
MNRSFCKLGIALIVACLVCMWPDSTSADARTDYLINMLEKGGNYRVREQAVTTLGKLRSAEAVPAIVRALEDDHEIVVISAATALGKIGDVSVIPNLEKARKSAPSTAARSQIEATIRVLRALSPDNGVAAQVDATPRYFVRIDAMGDSSGAGRKDITEILHKLVLKRIGVEPGVIVQKRAMTDVQVNKKLKKEKLSGYILTGSLIRMERVDNQIIVKLGLNVFTNPDYNLLMMPTAEGTITVALKENDEESEHRFQEKAIKSIVNTLVESIFLKLDQTKTQ